jgi:hypothetical protein
MDPVTMIGLIAVAGMFSTGVALVWLGLRRRPDRLPSGAHAVLAAVMEGQLARPDHAIDLVHPPPTPPRKSQPTPAVRVLTSADTTEPALTQEVPAPAAADVVAPEPETKPLTDEPTPVAVGAAPRSTGELDHALFSGVDDPSHDTGNAAASKFFAEKPELQRF